MTRTVRPIRRGAVMMEIVVSMAIFVAAGTLTMSIFSNAYDGLERTRNENLALDIARSKLAEIEAGLMPLSEFQREFVSRVGSFDLLDSAEYHGLDGEEQLWRMDVSTSPSAYPGLTLVEVRVFRLDAQGREAPSVTLRQLLTLRERPVDDYERDEMLEGLRGGEGRW